jgi:major membrane immunogen (membrane-anchored lipoprotein)
MKNKLIICLMSFLVLFGCGKVNYKDGTYTGESSEDDLGAYAKVVLVLLENRITNVDYVTIQADGSIKDEEYGKVNGEIVNSDFYDKAQLAVSAMVVYANELLEKQKVQDVTPITGATIAYSQFTEAVLNALDKAK